MAGGEDAAVLLVHSVAYLREQCSRYLQEKGTYACES